MSKFALIAAMLLLGPSSGGAAVPSGEGGTPTAAELQAFIEQSWPDFARRVRHQNRLIETPGRLTSLPRTLCRTELADTYECVSLVEYELPGGIRRSSFLRHDIVRDSRGRLGDAIIVRETPRPR
jgi:hypothetical protein